MVVTLQVQVRIPNLEVLAFSLVGLHFTVNLRSGISTGHAHRTVIVIFTEDLRTIILPNITRTCTGNRRGLSSQCSELGKFI